MKNILNKEEIVLIKICGKILKDCLFEVEQSIKPGITTKKLDEIAFRAIKKRNAKPSFLGYEVKGAGSFPSTLCVSANNEVVHGLPSERILREGDIVSLDIGAKYKGLYTDMAITVPVGEISKKAEELINTTKKCLQIGIKEAKAGNHIGNIGHSVQKCAEKKGFGVVRDLVGHGIGRDAHLLPHIPNFGDQDSGPIIEEGMALAIEPMLTEGNYNIQIQTDGWTVATKDNLLSAHFEHTIVIEKGKPVIVTA